ncbi:hypothetical protein [Parashewanella curva]|uniref:Rz1-like lysis system protein LysC n=1 Tax=Parashewanella curva TaxID=2338552 RepID=UPI003A598ACD
MLCACSSKPPIVRTVIKKEIQTVLAPEEMISQCRIPPVPVSLPFSNADLLSYGIELVSELEKCNADWQRLKNWRESKTNAQ